VTGRAARRGAVLIPAAVAVALSAACASSGRELAGGIRFYPRRDVAAERRDGGWQDVPILVVMEGTGSEGVRGPRALAVRDALWDRTPNRRDRWRVVLPGEAAGDTVGEVLWTPMTSMSRECTVFDITPSDGVRPERSTCTRVDTSAHEVWVTEGIQQAALDVGGNAVLLFREEYAGTFRGLRGYVLRCREEASGPAC